MGSQLLYLAAQKAAGAEVQKQNDLEPIFLGQMHGAELPRASFAYASHSFLKKFGGTYRPHPSEKDKLSVLTHKLWEKEGIRIDRSGTPLNEGAKPGGVHLLYRCFGGCVSAVSRRGFTTRHRRHGSWNSGTATA